MKQIEAKDFLFYYKPNIEELIISSGLKFIKRNNDEFKVDLNPNGESELTTVDFVNLDTNKKHLICSIGEKSVPATINTYFHINMLGFKVVMDKWKNIKSNNDLDKIDLFFTGNKFEHLYISKVKNTILCCKKQTTVYKRSYKRNINMRRLYQNRHRK